MIVAGTLGVCLYAHPDLKRAAALFCILFVVLEGVDAICEAIKEKKS